MECDNLGKVFNDDEIRKSILVNTYSICESCLVIA